jgi:hypothetical protein
MSNFRRFAPIVVIFPPFGYFPVAKNREEICDFLTLGGEGEFSAKIFTLEVVLVKVTIEWPQVKIKNQNLKIQKSEAPK